MGPSPAGAWMGELGELGEPSTSVNLFGGELLSWFLPRTENDGHVSLATLDLKESVGGSNESVGVDLESGAAYPVQWMV